MTALRVGKAPPAFSTLAARRADAAAGVVTIPLTTPRR
jgi:hypothetical protein